MTEIHSGSSGATSRAAAIAAFAFSVSKIVSISSRSTPPSASAAICSAYAARTSSNETARNAGIVDPRGERERDVERPDRAGDETRVAPRTRPRPARASRAPRGSSRARRLQPVVGLADARRGEGVRGRDVGARLEVPPVHVEDDVRPRQVEQVGIAGDVAGVVDESARRDSRQRSARRPGASSPRRRRARGSARGAVTRVCRVCRSSSPSSTSASGLKRLGAGARGLFRRFLDWSPSCLQSFPVVRSGYQ